MGHIQKVPVVSGKTGFTLIEILVGLSIVALLFVGGYASYREFARRQVLDNSFEELRSDLNLAQQKALSGEKPSGCTGTLLGYKVGFTQTSYSVAASCSLGEVVVRQFSLPNGVVLSAPASVLYKVIGEGTDLLADATIKLTQVSTGKTRQTTLTVGGTLR